jgi:hypothetical protein
VRLAPARKPPAACEFHHAAGIGMAIAGHGFSAEPVPAGIGVVECA